MSWNVTTTGHNRELRRNYTSLYKLWCNMINRCHNPNNFAYKYYGARGIIVDNSWLDFRVFLADMYPRPDKYELDRINNNGSYSKENTHWVLSINNKRKTRKRTSSVLTYSSIYRGVSYREGRKKPWMSRITIDSVEKHLGYFKTEEEAANAWNVAATTYFREFVILNEITPMGPVKGNP